MIELPDVTLVVIDCYYYGGAVAALRKSMEQVKFGRVVFLTDIPVAFDDFEVVKIPSIKSVKEYSRFCIKELYKYFDTDFVMLVQHDGYVISGESWDDEFYNYDFIGAPWLYTDGRNVGNGGVSIRSKKLQTALGTDPFIKISSPEDEIIGRLYRDYLEDEHGIKFPSEAVADKFSFELRTPVCKTFAFHGNFHEPFKETVVIKRTGALGDVVALEPLMDWYHKNGYRVVLDTMPQFFNLFQQHYYPVYHPTQIDGRIPVKHVNLDLSYEQKPSQLHLQSYYEFAGIEDGEIRNPKLHLNFDAKSDQFRLFKQRYAVIHIDRREQPARNNKGILWNEVALYLKGKGYLVVQIGKNDHEVIEGAIPFNASTEALLLLVCAGASLFVGCDSGISHICGAFDVPSVMFFGSVSPYIIWPKFDNKVFVHKHSGEGVCNNAFCWHEKPGTSGQPCSVDVENPPCVNFKTLDILKAINQLT